MEDALKPSDFFNADPNMVPCPKIALGLLLNSCQSFFTIHNHILAQQKAEIEPKPSDLMIDTLLGSQVMRACMVLYSQVPREERLILIKDSEHLILSDPGKLPKAPDMEDLI